ncbi:putative Spermidine/putrescine ABC transporter (permease protein) [Bradyrhizobium sp. ORS 285]|uniref:ABC transporter permease n=1 Tax=Bradyrhizobium sp. ORS 285 TaxID=115808 RepID=UPI000240AB48|nr:ABC transporter permease [Bradyrhizobium sp. ORS 285]CCD84743.1 putative Spermidine/putrescine ABC transporter (permease protein) [Bradyrhizobium sp. ORS 285]SMX60907.1 putative Spermidine/putrescine ABC transporter (permease protein) [Bradyrhizobium sp. ORS 285]
MLSFFVVPLVTMMKSAVSDPVATEALPRTARALSGWDRRGAPPAAAQAAFADDIRALENDEQFGDLVRRLNSAQSGFRSLLGKTRRALDGSGAVDLASIDPRWSETSYWTTIAEAVASPWTDKNLLAAVDLERNASGSIAAMPEGASANRLIMIRTFITSALVTLACILIGLPYAMVAASVEGWRRQVLLGAVLLPLWTSLLVRTAAWYVVLQDNGLINATLKGLGLTSAPIPLMFNRLGVVIAMTHVLLPFMVLPIFSVLISIPRNLMPAAASLGAHPLRAFFHVLLPLSMRGVVSGALLVFMAALGYYITPALIGGANDQMISSVIAYYATGAANWGMAGALGLVLLAMTILLYAIYMRLTVEEQRA